MDLLLEALGLGFLEEDVGGDMVLVGFVTLRPNICRLGLIDLR